MKGVSPYTIVSIFNCGQGIMVQKSYCCMNVESYMNRLPLASVSKSERMGVMDLCMIMNACIELSRACRLKMKMKETINRQECLVSQGHSKAP